MQLAEPPDAAESSVYSEELVNHLNDQIRVRIFSRTSFLLLFQRTWLWADCSLSYILNARIAISLTKNEKKKCDFSQFVLTSSFYSNWKMRVDVCISCWVSGTLRSSRWRRNWQKRKPSLIMVSALSAVVFWLHEVLMEGFNLGLSPPCSQEPLAFTAMLQPWRLLSYPRKSEKWQQNLKVREPNPSSWWGNAVNWRIRCCTFQLRFKFCFFHCDWLPPMSSSLDSKRWVTLDH